MVSLASSDRGVIAPAAGGSLKRKQTDTPFDSDNLPSSQAKRLRVTFDPDVDVRILPDWNEKSLELVGEEVRRALDRHATNDNAVYDQIRHLLTLKPTSSEAPLSGLLQKYVIALTNNVPSLDHKCSGLVHAIIDCNWVARNEQFVRSYRHLLRSLISVQPGYTNSVLHMLVNMFVELPSPSLRQQDDPSVPRSRLQSRTHECLRYLLRQNLMTSTHLSPILASYFPFPTDTTKAHVRYIKNLVTVTGYLPELKGEILALILDRLVKIDVKIQVDMEELEDDIEEHLVEAHTKDEEEEEEDADVSDDESVSSEESLNDEERHLKELKESVIKLDAIMDILFSYYASIFAEGDLLNVDHAFESLLSQFSNIILPTYRSRHTQFLVFHFCQSSPDFIERFAGCCSHLAFDQRRPHILRIAAAAYLASFIARGAHVSSSVVRNMFDLLCNHLEKLRTSQEPTCKAPDLRRYGTYYATAQALLYTFCFRWRDLIVTEDGAPLTDQQLIYQEGDFIWYKNIQDTLRRNIFSKLNPLKVCSPSIVTQFARIAHHLRFLYVFPLIETNKRIRLARSLAGGYMDGVAARETALTMKNGEESFLLDAYFPFDPYVLPRSKRWLEGDYVQWRPIPGMDPAGANHEEGGEEEADEYELSDSEKEGEDEEEVELDDETGTDVTL
ncbi:RNA polymerase I-specific transcription initiation factor RRN3 [Zopfia rhizophila CBS 207.26]|uniref:RNA polymerase I-specific transcription initiation factor RRN3 n=1 Tax=Zopfia rhizophila CBS 207.26 TaxID=1314779 RepID=A0A6A6E4V0_9PEZI|nr:RNA polymerase I-specific transcription initiation factor RRN3 [Zopfia rhizophila CBS 207.26]